jgi:polyisoprenoid-binding protein YceI
MMNGNEQTFFIRYSLLKTSKSAMKMYYLNSKKSTIRWDRKVNDSIIEGHVNFKEGYFIYELDKLLEGNAVIDLRTIAVDGVSGKEKHEEEEHLKSGNLLDVHQYPLATYKFDSVHDVGEGKEIRGMLLFKNKAFHLTIPVGLSQSGSSFSVSSEFSANRLNPMLFDALTESDAPVEEERHTLKICISVFAEERETRNK